MTALPTWIDKEAWDGFKTMRVKLKKPMTARAEMLILKALYDFKEEGHDPNACLDASVINCWAGVFAPKTANNRPTDGQLPPDMTPEEWEAAAEARKAVAAKFKLRRVA